MLTTGSLRQPCLLRLPSQRRCLRSGRSSRRMPSAGVMLVQCGDAHDMVGHFPLRCYPANGWDLKSSAPRALLIEDRAVQATEYEFVLPDQAMSGGGERHIFVINCLFRPGGKVFAA